jgi:hypothetical protein
MENNKSEQLSTMVKLARETAILGDYENSTKNYQLAIKIAQSLMNGATANLHLHSSWRDLGELLVSECKLIQ